MANDGGVWTKIVPTDFNLGGGKVLQVVRAHNNDDNHSSTTTDFIDVPGCSVTITPQKSDSAVMLVAAFKIKIETSSNLYCTANFMLTDSSDATVSGSNAYVGTRYHAYVSGNTGSVHDMLTLIGFAKPATTSATTYKLRYKSPASNITVTCENKSTTLNMYAIELADVVVSP